MEGISRACATFALNAAWQVVAIAVAAALGGWLMRKAPARYQHALWLLALLLSVALPLATVLPLDAASEIVVANPVASALGLTEPPPLLPPREAQSRWTFSRPRWNLPLASGAGGWLAAVIGLAFLARAAALVRALRAAQARRRTARADVPERLSALRRISEQALGLRNVPVLAVPGLAGPVTLGVWRRVILWPEGFWEGQPDDVLLAALGHEMAHIRRRDYGLNLLYELALLPLAWHPATRILRQKIDQTREMACDEMVAEKLLDGPRYARSLVAIAATAIGPAELSPALGVTDGDILKQRVRRLLAGWRNSGKLARCEIVAGLALLAVVGLVASLGAVEPGKPVFEVSAGSVAGLWRGGNESHTFMLRLSRSGNAVSGRLELARNRAVSAQARLAVPPPPPPPPPAPPPAAGEFAGAVLTGDTLHFRVRGASGRTTEYELRLSSDQAAFLYIISAGKPVYPTAVPMVKAQ